jgi:hypothetical protein
MKSKAFLLKNPSCEHHILSVSYVMLRSQNGYISALITPILFSAIMLLSSVGHTANHLRPTPFASEAKAEPDTVEKKPSRLIGYPIIFHSPETKLGIGATGSYFYRSAGSDTASRPSTIGSTLIYTQKQQIEIGAGADLYWKKDTYHFSGGIIYSKFPNTFYGIGNNISGCGRRLHSANLLNSA